jgi:putative transposase
VLAGQHSTPELGHEDPMHIEGSHDVAASTVVVILSHRPPMLGGMLVRYRYRIDPTGVQRQALARAFGCARVVYNDALAERRHAYQAEEKLGDTEIQRRVITQAKRTPERAWLTEVASVALVQACQDARRAYRNWFDSRSGRRKGRRVGQPRVPVQARPPVDPAHPQRLRPARDQAVCGQGRGGAGALVAGVAVAAIQRHRPPRAGRPLLRLLCGRCDPTPLPPVARTSGIDLGLVWLAAVAASDGTVEQVANPRHLRAAQRQLARAQRQLARKRKGSANRAKARHWVAVAHRRVRDRRADHHHKLALRLIRENQVVAVEDWCVAGLGRTRLAKSVHDAGWATLVRLLEHKAAQHGRRVVKIGRWEPTSQLCSACRHRDGPKPLGVRAWACPACGVVQDRDANAARNILVAGRAGGDTKRLWRQCQPRETPGSCR